MTDISTTFRKLLEGLYIKTNQQVVIWNFNQSESLCESSIGDGYVQVFQEADEDGDYYNYVRVLNGDRDVVDTIYGGALGRGASPANTGHADYWDLMRDLYSAARRSALGADKVIGSMVKALGADDLDMSDIPF